jgi:hypothetical protein
MTTGRDRNDGPGPQWPGKVAVPPLLRHCEARSAVAIHVLA